VFAIIPANGGVQNALSDASVSVNGTRRSTRKKTATAMQVRHDAGDNDESGDYIPEEPDHGDSEYESDFTPEDEGDLEEGVMEYYNNKEELIRVYNGKILDDDELLDDIVNSAEYAEMWAYKEARYCAQMRAMVRIHCTHFWT